MGEAGVREAVAARLDVSGAPKAKTIGFSANPQGCIKLALDLALFLKLFLQDCSQVLLFERLFACMACRGAGVRVSSAPLDPLGRSLASWLVGNYL